MRDVGLAGTLLTNINGNKIEIAVIGPALREEVNAVACRIGSDALHSCQERR